MFSILITACALASPNFCETSGDKMYKINIAQEEANQSSSCFQIMMSPLTILSLVEWNQSHPKLYVKKWTCVDENDSKKKQDI